VGDMLYTVKTDIGWMAVWADDRNLLGLGLGHQTEPQAVRALAKKCRLLSSDPPWKDRPHAGWQDGLLQRLVDFAAGQRTDFADVPLDLSRLTSFRRRVVEACRGIPFGETATYSQLAVRAGSPQAARAVGTTMAQNWYPIVVPCHRVIGADGTLRGFSAPRGILLKQRLLKLERASEGYPAPSHNV